MEQRTDSDNGRFKAGNFFFGAVILVLFAPLFSLMLLLDCHGPGLGHWVRVPCRIVRSEVVRENPGRFVFTAVFAYERDGRTLEAPWLQEPSSGTILLHRGRDADAVRESWESSAKREFMFGRLEDRLPMLAKYAPGTEHVCLVDSLSPEVAVLPVSLPGTGSQADPGGNLVVGVAVIELWVGGIVLVATAFPSVRRRLPGDPQELAKAFVLTLFGLPFATIGLTHMPEAIRSHALVAGPWRAVPATVLYAGTTFYGSGSPPLYSVRVGYEYEIGGETFEGDRFDSPISDTGYSRHPDIRKLEAAYPEGKKIRVWVSERDPRRSALRRPGAHEGIAWDLFFLSFGFLGLVATGGGLYLLHRELARGRCIGTQNRWVLKRWRAGTILLAVMAVLANLLGWGFAFAFLGGPHEPIDRLAAIFPAAGVVLAVLLVIRLVRDARAPDLALVLTSPDPDDPAHALLEWRLAPRTDLAALELWLSDDAEDSRRPTPNSRRIARHEAPSIPAAATETLPLPLPYFPKPSQGSRIHARGMRTIVPPRYCITARFTLRTSSRPLVLSYPLPDTLPVAPAP